MNDRWMTLCLLGLVCAWGAGAPRRVCAQEEVGPRLEGAVGDDFWGAVLVRKHGKVLLEKGYGKADLAKRDITDQSLFDIGSVAKQFTAAAVLKLQMQGKLSVEDRLADHVEGVPEDKLEITVYDLLTHMSGLAVDIAWTGAEVAERDRMVARVLSEPLNAVPGDEFQYSNVGYFVLAALIEIVSEESFEGYLKKQLFRPARMKSTGFVGDRSLKRSRQTARVFEGKRSTVLTYPFNWANRGATGVVTTTRDLALWDEALRGTKVLDGESKALLFEPREEEYACGWRIEDSLAGEPKQHHGGSTRGYRAELARYPDDELLIVVLTNNDHDPTAIVGRLEAALFGKEGVPAGEEGALLGRYALPSGGHFEIARGERGLVVRAMGTEACCRVFYGLERLPDWPQLMAQMGAAGQASFERLAKGGAKAAKKLLPEPDAFLATWADLVQERGAYKGFEVIGSNSGRAMNTYVRATFGKAQVVFRLDWGQGRNLARVERVAAPHPYEIRLVPLEAGGTFGGQSLFRGRRVGVAFDQEDGGRATALTWSDATAGQGGRIVCARLD